jgi:hypothetical protein
MYLLGSTELLVVIQILYNKKLGILIQVGSNLDVSITKNGFAGANLFLCWRARF